MGRILKIFFLGISLTFLTGQHSLFSQEVINPENEYLRIREMAFSGDYANAEAEARKLVNAFPRYGDARILLGRILAWQKNYNDAAAVIDTLLKTEPDNADALSARRDITLWSKSNTPVATDIRAGYSFDTFSEPYKRFWQVFQAGAGHRFGWGPAAFYVNTGNVIIGDPSPRNETEVQFEVEAYPALGKKNYAYLDYAYSPGSWFPTHRGAIELWQNLPAGWVISAGGNYYYFDRNIFIALASVEKYLGKYWFSLKGFVYFKKENPTTSFYFNARRYFNDTDYLQLTLGTGTAPDEPWDIQTDIERLNANSVRVAYNVAVSRKLTVRVGAGYSREEYQESLLRNRFEGNVNLVYAIKMK